MCGLFWLNRREKEANSFQTSADADRRAPPHLPWSHFSSCGTAWWPVHCWSPPGGWQQVRESCLLLFFAFKWFVWARFAVHFRIQELQQEVTALKLDLERAQGGIKHLNTQVREIFMRTETEEMITPEIANHTTIKAKQVWNRNVAFGYSYRWRNEIKRSSAWIGL